MKRMLLLLLALIPLFICAGCAAGNPQFGDNPAGFWAGLWHGFICLITFIISLFKDSVRIYQTANTGHLYDLGFVLGVACFFGGGCGCRSSSKSKWSCCTSKEEKEWDAIGDKVEAKVRSSLKHMGSAWASGPAGNWPEPVRA